MKQLCYSLAVGACLVTLGGSATNAAPPARAQPATFTTPFAHATDPVYHTQPGQFQAQPGQYLPQQGPYGPQQGQYGPQPYRWGWFGADYYAPAPKIHRDYNRGWTEWHYRR